MKVRVFTPKNLFMHIGVISLWFQGVPVPWSPFGRCSPASGLPCCTAGVADSRDGKATVAWLPVRH